MRHLRHLSFVLAAILSPLPHAAADQAEAGRPELDRTKPVPPKSEIVTA